MARKPIPDDQPMSRSTRARRRKAAGLTTVRQPSEVDTAFFATWSHELAWLVGLIWSDGCLSKNTIDICSKDFQLIELVLAITKGHYALKNKGEHLRVHFSNKEVAGFLRSIGLTEKKSLTIGWPIIPDEYSADFMRGLIDGDGSVFVTKLRPGQQAMDIQVQLVTASPHLRDGVTKWFKDNGIHFLLSVRKSNNPLWRFVINRQESLRSLYGLLYHCEDVTCLHRKRSPYVEWMNTPRVKPGRPISHYPGT